MAAVSLRAAAAALAISLSLVATPALASGVSPSQATPVQREQAQSRFVKGKEKFAKGDHEGALAELTASLDIVASPNTRLYVARCLRDMNRIVAAYAELGRTEVEAKELAREDPRYEKTGQAAREERIQLEPKLGFVNIDIAHAEPTTTLKVAGDEVRRGGWNEPIPVLPGTSEILVETPGRAPVRKSVTLAATEKQSLAIDVADGAVTTSDGGAATATVAPTNVATSSSGLRSAAYVAGGAAIVGLGMFAFFGLKANGTYSDLDSACGGAACPPGHEADIGEGRANQTAANIGLGVFAVGAVAAVTLWLLGAPSKPASTGTTARGPTGPSFSGLRGTF